MFFNFINVRGMLSRVSSIDILKNIYYKIINLNNILGGTLNVV